MRAREDDVAVFDLDGTIVGTNSFPVFTQFALRWSAVHRPVVAARLTREILRRKVFGGVHLELKQAVDEAAATIPPQVLDRWASGLLLRHGNPEVLRMITSWTGPRVLCTAAPSAYAIHLGHHLGMRDTVGSAVRDGRYDDNVGEAKVVNLRRELRLERVALMVTDDPVVDLPLLSWADRGLVVDASGKIRDWEPAD